MFTTSISAGQKYVLGGLIYEVQGNGDVVIVDYQGRDEEVIIPDTIAGSLVTGIASGAFVGTSAKEVVIPETVTNIEGAFDDDVRLEISNGSSASYQEQHTTEDNKEPENKSTDVNQTVEVDNTVTEISDYVEETVEVIEEVDEIEIDEDNPVNNGTTNNKGEVTGGEEPADEAEDISTYKTEILIGESQTPLTIYVIGFVVIVVGIVFLVKKIKKNEIKK